MGFRLGLPQPHSSKCLIPLWLSPLKRPSRFGRGRKAGDVSDPPKNRGVMRSRTDGIWNMPLYRPPMGSLTSSFIPAGKARNSTPQAGFFQGVGAALGS